jgi:hypothetical protein
MATNTRTRRKSVSEKLDETADAVSAAPKAPAVRYESAEERRLRERRERTISTLVSETRNGGMVIIRDPKLGGYPYSHPKRRMQARLSFSLSIPDVVAILARAGVETTADEVAEMESREYDFPSNQAFWNTPVAKAYRRFLHATQGGPPVEAF